MQKDTKIQASVQHGLYLFTCESSSVNSNRIFCIFGTSPWGSQGVPKGVMGHVLEEKSPGPPIRVDNLCPGGYLWDW